MQVILFGITKDIVGQKKLAVDNAENIATVGELKSWLKQKYPALKTLTSFAVAVNSEYADDDLPLINTNEVALIPPVSGG